MEIRRKPMEVFVVGIIDGIFIVYIYYIQVTVMVFQGICHVLCEFCFLPMQKRYVAAHVKFSLAPEH